MGQRVSYTSPELLVTIHLASDSVAQILLDDSGLSAGQVFPAPGWHVQALGNRLVFHRRIGSSSSPLVAYAASWNERLAILQAPPAPGTMVHLSPYTAAALTAPDASAGVWVTRPLEFDPAPYNGDFTLVLPPQIRVARTAARWALARVYGGVDPVDVAVTSGEAQVNSERMLVPTADRTGTFNVTVVATDHVGTQRTAHTQVTVTSVQKVAPQATHISLATAALPLTSALFDPSGQASHLMIMPRQTATLTLQIGSSDAEQDLLQPSAQAAAGGTGVLWLPGKLYSLRLTQTTPPASLDFLLSLDSGLTFTRGNTIYIGREPCIAGAATLHVRLPSGTQADMNVQGLKAGYCVLDRARAWRRVSRVHRAPLRYTIVVVIPAHTFGPDEPRGTLRVTPNHRIWCPGWLKPSAAGALVKRWPGLHFEAGIYELTHLELADGYGYFMLDGVAVESWAATKAMSASRDQQPTQRTGPMPRQRAGPTPRQRARPM